MEQVIVYRNPNGSTSVCYPLGVLPIEEVQARDIPPDVQSFIIPKANLPQEHHDFFDAWVFDGVAVAVDFQRAIEVTKARLRVEREPLFAPLDAMFQKALETGADTTAIVAEKQRLRDLPSLADTCTTLDELRALKAQ